jgi:hypothetical protein
VYIALSRTVKKDIQELLVSLLRASSTMFESAGSAPPLARWQISMSEGTMRTRILVLIATASLLFGAFFSAPRIVSAAGDPPSAAALVGQVSSQEEGPMEGVVVSAKKDG